MDKVHHIALQVKDIEEAINFYKEKFDVKISYQDETWALIDFENISVALVLPNQHPPHFAILRDDAEEFGELTTHRDNTKSVYIEDSDNNIIEIMKL